SAADRGHVAVIVDVAAVDQGVATADQAVCVVVAEGGGDAVDDLAGAVGVLAAVRVGVGAAAGGGSEAVAVGARAAVGGHEASGEVVAVGAPQLLAARGGDVGEHLATLGSGDGVG